MSPRRATPRGSSPLIGFGFLALSLLLPRVLIHQHVRAPVEQAVHEELAEVLGVELYERSEARRRQQRNQTVHRIGGRRDEVIRPSSCLDPDFHLE